MWTSTRAGSAKSAEVQGGYNAIGALDLWSSDLTGAMGATWAASATKTGVRITFTFPAGATFTKGKTLAQAVGDRLSASPLKTLELLGMAMKNDKLDLGVASVSVPPAFTYTVPYVAPELDAKRTRATGPTSAAVIFTFAPTNRAPAGATVRLTPTLGGKAVTVPLEFKAGGALTADVSGLEPGTRYTIALTVTDKNGKVVANTVRTKKLPTLATPMSG